VGMGGTIGVQAVTMGTDALAEGVPVVPGIWVNVNGQRFVNEATHYAYSVRAVFNQQAHVAWAIFDDKVRSMGGAALGGIWGAWSDDLKDEMSKGRVKSAATLAELAKAIGVNADALPLTVQKWNEDAKAGKDTIFQKQVGLQALETGPFYAVQVTSVNLGSCGGLKINAKCQVIDVNGQAIPHLYAGGMAAGGFCGPYYPGSGTAVLATVVLGRIAGENAAKETAA
jgi:urocanate reductase